MKTRTHSRSFPLLPIVIMLVSMVAVLAGGIIYYQFQKERITRESQQELRTIAELRASQIEQWLQERIGDGNAIINNPLISHHFRTYAVTRTDTKLRSDITGWMDMLRGAYQYDAVVLCDTSGTVYLHTGDTDSLDAEDRRTIRTAVAQRSVLLSDLHLEYHRERIRVNLVVPIFDPASRTSGNLAILISIDPAVHLYPLLQSKPVPHHSFESFLFHQAGDSVEFLSNLLHIPNAALRFRISLRDTERPVVQSLLDSDRQTFVGEDYRGIPVVASVHHVNFNAWYLLAKVDSNEMFAPLKRELQLAVVMTLLGMLASLFGIGFVWRAKRAEYYRERLMAEEMLQAVIASSPTAMLFFRLDADGSLRLTGSNPTAETMFGRPLASTTGERLEEAFPGMAAMEFPAILRGVAAGDTDTKHFETPFRNGPFNGHLDIFVYRTGPLTIAVDMVDITEKKNAEIKLLESEQLLAKSFSNSPIPMSLTDMETHQYLNVNHAWRKLYGYDRTEVIGKQAADLGLFLNDSDRTLLLARLKSEGHVTGYPSVVRTKTGEMRHGNFSLEQFTVADRSMMLSLFYDTTEQRFAQEQLLKSQSQYRLLAQNVNDVIWILDVASMRFTYVSPSVERLRGFTPAEVMTQSLEELMTPSSLEQMQSVLPSRVERFLSGDQDAAWNMAEIEQLCADGSTVWTEVVTTIVRDDAGTLSIIGVSRNIEERKRAEGNILSLYRLYIFISEINKLIVRVKSRDALFNGVCRIATEAGGFRMAWAGVVDEASGTVRPVAWSGHVEGYLDGLNISILDTPEGRGPTGTALREQRHFVINNIAEDPRMLPWRERAMERGYASSIGCPLVINGRSVGVLTLYSDKVNCFSQEELDLLDHVSGDISYALEVLENEAIRRQKEDELRLKDIVFETSVAANTIADLHGTITQVNRSALSLWGYDTADEVRGLPLRSFIQSSGIADEIAVAVRTRGRWVGEYSAVRKDGSTFTALAMATVIRNSAEEPIGFQSSVLDVTEQRSLQAALASKEQQYRELFESSIDAVYKSTHEGRFLEVNSAMVRLLGYESKEELMAVHIPTALYFHESDRDLPSASVMRGEDTIYALKRKDGTPVWVEDHGRFITDEQGQVLFHEGILRDVTERVKAEEKLMQYTKKLEEAERTTRLGSWDYVLATGTRWWSKHMFELLNFVPAAEAPDTDTYLDHIHPEDREVIREAFQTMAAGGTPTPREFRTNPQYGPERYLLPSFEVERDANGVPLKYNGTTLDITERKNIQLALQEQQDVYAAVFDNANESIALLDPETGAFHSFNDTACGSLGYTREEFSGMALKDIKVGMPDEEIPVYLRSLAVQGSKQFDSLHRHKDGTVRERFISTRVVNVRGKQLIASIWSDITERRRSEMKIRQLSHAVEQLASTVVITDTEGIIEYANQAFTRTSGYEREEVIGKHPSVLKSGHTSDEEYKRMWETITAGGVWQGEFYNKKKNGELYWELAVISPVRNEHGEIVNYIAVKEDITERKMMQDQLLRSQRMESIGTLAGGIAHDLNNILGPILLSVQVLRMKVKDDTLANLIDTIESSTVRGKNIVSQVLGFARGTESRPVLLQAKHIIREVENVIRQTFAKNIDIHSVIPKDLWTIHADPTQVHQVLMNLCVNARDAMPNGGVLTINARNITLDETLAARHPDAREGRYIELDVRDTGTGIPKDVLQKVFDPFFTTKEPGKGTGLGLSTVYTIVKQHRGFITVETAVGDGTAFQVFLPASEESLGTEAAPAVMEVPQGNQEQVLVVDDETAILTVCKETLEFYHFSVVAAGNGAEGISRFVQGNGRIRVVLIDMMMPVMDGRTAAAAIRKIDPSVRIIGMSGLMNETKQSESEGVFTRFLRKPFTGRELMDAITNALQ